MESTRRSQAKQELGLDHSKEDNQINKSIAKEEERRLRKERKRQELLNCTTYQIMEKVANVMDRYMLDPLLGFIPGIGDAITAATALPFLHFCIFKVKSAPLTLAVLNNILLDTLLGMIPAGVGNIIDFFNRSNIRNLELIVNYINDDESTISEVNSKAIWMVVIMAILITLIILMAKLVVIVVNWIGGWFN